MKTILLLVRHGETVDNVGQIMQGQTQGQLTAQGIRQAEALRDRLAADAIDAVVASDLRRATDTARIVAAPHGLTVVTTPLLRERDWGDFTGRYIPSLKGEPWPQNVEPLEALMERARRLLHDIYNEYPGLTVLAVGHGIVNKAIQAVYHHCTMSQISRMQNAEVRMLLLRHDERQTMTNDKFFGASTIKSERKFCHLMTI